MTDVGKSLFCRVTATNAAGSASADSNTVGPVVAAPSGFTYLVDTEAQGNDSIVTSAIDTTGAGLLIVVGAEVSGAAVFADSKGNTWTAAGTGECKILYSYPTSVGTGHTVTVSGGSIYASVCFMAFSGGGAGAFVDDASNAGSGTTATGGSVTPTQNGSLIISAVTIKDAISGASSVGSGFTKICDLPRGGTWGLSAGYLIQPTMAAVNPSWTCPGTDHWSAANAVFSPA